MLNVQRISTKELRDNLSEILEKVAIGGDSFIIFKFGREKAYLTPVSRSKKEKETKNAKLRDLPGRGMWADRKDIEDSVEWVLKTRKRWSKRLHG